MTQNTHTPSPDAPVVTAAMLIIGDEILSGRTQDANLAYLARGLGSAGVRLREVRVVPDVEEEIVTALNALRDRYDYVFTTGGIGPTHDDITAASVARAFGVPLIRHPEAWELLSRYYETLEVEMNAARARMANTPEGAVLIHNPISTAPGFIMENVHVMAGVPKIMQEMLDGILPTLRGGAVVLSRTVFSSLPEGSIAAGLEAIQMDNPQLSVGSYPAWSKDRFRLSLVLRGTDEARLDKAAAAVVSLIEELGGEAVLTDTGDGVGGHT